MGDLETRRADFQLKLATKRKEIKRAEAKLSRLASKCKPTKRLQHLSVAVYCQSDFNIECAVDFMECRLKRYKGLPWGRAELATYIEDAFLDHSDEDIRSMVEGTHSSSSSSMRLASAWSRGWKISRWCYDVNNHFGIAPSTQMVVSAFEGGEEADLAAVLRNFEYQHTDNAQRMRVWRWRRRFRVALLRLPNRHRLPMDVLRAKVRDEAARLRGAFFGSAENAPREPKWGPIFAAIFRPHFLARRCPTSRGVV